MQDDCLQTQKNGPAARAYCPVGDGFGPQRPAVEGDIGEQSDLSKGIRTWRVHGACMALFPTRGLFSLGGGRRSCLGLHCGN